MRSSKNDVNDDQSTKRSFCDGINKNDEQKRINYSILQIKIRGNEVENKKKTTKGKTVLGKNPR